MPQTRSSTPRKQSRLTFTPLPSSSPDTKSSRAASIRYEPMSTPRKRGRVSPSSNLHLNSASRVISGETSLPTPVASSQLEQIEQDEQGVIEFSSSSESTLQSATEGQRSSKTFGRLARPMDMDSHTKPVAFNPSKKPIAKAFLPIAAGFTKANSNSLHNSSGSSDEGDIPVRSAVRRKARPAVISSGSEDESDPVLPKSGGRRGNTTKLEVFKSPKTQSLHTPKSSRAGPLDFILGGNTGNVPLSHSQRKRFDTRKTSQEIERNTIESDTDEEDDQTNQTPSKKSKMNVIPTLATSVSTNNTDDSSEDLVISPKRRRLVAKNLEHSPQNELDHSHNQVAEDLQEDLDDLRDTEIHKRRTRGRMINSKNSAKQKQLEILKRRRAGANAIELSSDSDVVSQTSPSRDTKQINDQVNVDNQSDEDEISDMEAVRQSLRAGDNDEDSFVDSDDENTLGAPDWRNEIPLEFSAHSMQKPIKNFKVAVEWMIHNKLNPAFARNDEIYSMAITRLDDEVQGYSGSKFLSPVWNKEFLKILKGFPELSIIDVPTMFDHKCDACNRSGHPAKHQLNFGGRPYDRKTLESLSSDEDSENQSEDGSNDKESLTFYLGRTCAANAETGHNLHHWRYDLNFYVINWLKKQGHVAPEKILERENWSTKKREKYSNDVVDEMEESGELRTLYDEFKQNLQAARTARPDRYTYGRR